MDDHAGRVEHPPQRRAADVPHPLPRPLAEIDPSPRAVQQLRAPLGSTARAAASASARGASTARPAASTGGRSRSALTARGPSRTFE